MWNPYNLVPETQQKIQTKSVYVKKITKVNISQSIHKKYERGSALYETTGPMNTLQ